MMFDVSVSSIDHREFPIEAIELNKYFADSKCDSKEDVSVIYNRDKRQRGMDEENGVYIEEGLLEVLGETDLLNFRRKIIVELQLSRLEHFDHVTDEELRSYAGISLPAIRRLRLAIAEKRKKSKKSKGLFGTISKKESREVTKILLPSTTDFQKPETSGTCLITKDQITLLERLGEGSFAVVKRGIWKKSDKCKVDVAVKILRESSTQVIQDLQLEVNNMQKLVHPNLIQLYGIVFDNPAMMVVEYCDGGSLLDRLRSVEKPVLLVSMLVEFVQQIAKGMAYLESKHCVHRDLAARNVLLTDNERVAKICDFGLMRILEDNERLYVMSAQKKVPFSWCPPESLRHRRFSHASDVWSFGVTMWELFSYGEEPWTGLRGADVLKKLESGERLFRPRNCPIELYDLMTQCWSSSENSRPRFTLLKGFLSDVKFMIAECREASSTNSNVDLNLRIDDRVLVIDGNGEIWFGQNIRTRCFGHFYRSCVYVRSDRNMSTSNSMGDGCWLSNEMNSISKPVPDFKGSFIHAGHGDINPGQSWGQPDRIDDIYLKNPILRRQEDIPNDAKQRRLGPEIINSVIGMQSLKVPSIEKSTKNEVSSVDISSSVDPFAPFSDYSYDIFYEKSPEPSTTNPNPKVVDPPEGSKPQPLSFNPDYCNVRRGLNGPQRRGQFVECSVSQVVPVSYDRPPEAPVNKLQEQTRPVSEIVGNKPAVKPASPILPPEKPNGTNKEYSSLPRPTRSTSDLKVLSGRSHAALTPPPIRANDFVDNKAAVQSEPGTSKPSAKTSDVSWTTSGISGADVTKLANVLSHSSATKQETAFFMGSNSNNPVQPASVSDRKSVFSDDNQVTHPQKHIGVGDGSDPFEVPLQVKTLANRGLYSQMLLNASNKPDTSFAGNQTTIPVRFRGQSYDRLLTHKNSTPILGGYGFPQLSSYNSTDATSQSVNYLPNSSLTVPYWQPSGSTTFGNKPALVYDAQYSRLKAMTGPSRITGLKTIPTNNRPLEVNQPSTSSKRSSFISDEILGLFDPLANYSVLNMSSKETTRNTNQKENDSLENVMNGAAFAREECCRMLQKCGNDVASAIKELKIGQLIAVGIAKDRAHSITALEDCNWDLNAAAGALIS